MHTFGGSGTEPSLAERIALARKRLARNAEIMGDSDRAEIDRVMAQAQFKRWEEILDGYIAEWWEPVKGLGVI